MARPILRRLVLILPALLLVNFLGYAYAHLVLPLRLARTPYLGAAPETQPLLPAYLDYLGKAGRLDLGTMPVGRADQSIAAAIGRAGLASLGLLALSFALSVALGLVLGVCAARTEPRGIARWFAPLATIGLALPSFYIGSLLVLAVLFLVPLRGRGAGPPVPIYGYGWDLHLLLPTLALVARPTVQIAQVSSTLLVEELGKRYIVTARSVGHRWNTIRWRHALRNVLPAVVQIAAGSFRLLMAELILVEWLFGWPGLGRLLAQTLVPPFLSTQLLASPLFLNPSIVSTVVTLFAALFLGTDLLSAILVRAADPRFRTTTEGTTGSELAAQPTAGRWNWHLVLGGLAVLVVVFVSAAGPAIAPQDPLQEHSIIQVGDGWQAPPFPAFAVPGFPLGSDQFGRDTLSWLLWAARPTMILVASVALIRLGLGAIIGIVAGWSKGRLGQLLDTLISGALSLPVLMVALVSIAAVGPELGLTAFVVGLSITGWGETARILREQTELVGRQQFIEATRALGASGRRILLRHVLPHVLPLLVALLALELSATLIATAGLGFLGYYIGGDVWIEVDDWTARRLSQSPELGQMLAQNSSAVAMLANPWPMVAAGTLIFLAVLGFNLLGEGLRQQVGLERGYRSTALSRAWRSLSLRAEEQIWLPLSGWVQGRPRQAAAAGLLILVTAGALIGWRLYAASRPEALAVVLEVPGGHLWACAEHDPYGTRWTSAIGPAEPQVRWTFADPTGFAGGPAVAADGTLYIASNGGTLYALAPDGKVRWKAELPGKAAGTPALGIAGEIYVADTAAGLGAFSTDGIFRWRFQAEGQATSKGGPIVDRAGTIYYRTSTAIHALRSDGTLLWATAIPYVYYDTAPGLSPEGDLLYWQDQVLSAADGSRRDLQMPVMPSAFFTGADGQVYFLAENTVAQYRLDDSRVQVVSSAAVSVSQLGYPEYTRPRGVGVSAKSSVWLFYTHDFAGGRTTLVRLAANQRMLGIADLRFWGVLLAVDGQDTTYICSSTSAGTTRSIVKCLAFASQPGDPLWEVHLEGPVRPEGQTMISGALVPGTLYVATTDGWLYAVGDRQP